MNEKLNTYAWVLRRPVSTSSKECDEFSKYVREQVSRAEDLLKFEKSTEATLCIIDAKMKCRSCGSNSPNKFRRNILIKFPDADVRELRRERLSGKST